jgi:hypothetical protein
MIVKARPRGFIYTRLRIVHTDKCNFMMLFGHFEFLSSEHEQFFDTDHCVFVG